MTKKDARLILAAMAKAVRERFVHKSEYGALVRRVEWLERQLAELTKQREEAS